MRLTFRKLDQVLANPRVRDKRTGVEAGDTLELAQIRHIWDRKSLRHSTSERVSVDFDSRSHEGLLWGRSESTQLDPPL
ncbi:hypothetical protein Poly41_41350 [Novipirellula artificiosorum]|uniref:Uncharacterized protein n=1 Tax=Novipirellula artificiosorum TaxID=2528016 RepID=A0A5C6DGX4_9BACT|nr:hypothetical protein Poly41_41350 [Novipirellula artificiosorum]